MAGIRLRGLTKTYRLKEREIQALGETSLDLAEGGLTVVVGRSGSGKTTLLRLLCGLEAPDRGEVMFTKNGHPIPRQEVRVGIVFQEPRLMPWLTLEQNLGLALYRQKDQAAVRERVKATLDMLGLSAFSEALPARISGGMAQRAALGRTLCQDPDVILMDEPFGSLDALTRRRLQNELIDIFRQGRKTILFVTHDVDEAVLLGTSILVMDQGRVTVRRETPLPYPRDPRSRDFFTARQDILDAIFEHDPSETFNPPEVCPDARP